MCHWGGANESSFPGISINASDLQLLTIEVSTNNLPPGWTLNPGLKFGTDSMLLGGAHGNHETLNGPACHGTVRDDLWHHHIPALAVRILHIHKDTIVNPLTNRSPIRSGVSDV